MLKGILPQDAPAEGGGSAPKKARPPKSETAAPDAVVEEKAPKTEAAAPEAPKAEAEAIPQEKAPKAEPVAEATPEPTEEKAD